MSINAFFQVPLFEVPVRQAEEQIWSRRILQAGKVVSPLEDVDDAQEVFRPTPPEAAPHHRRRSQARGRIEGGGTALYAGSGSQAQRVPQLRDTILDASPGGPDHLGCRLRSQDQ